MWEVYDDHLQFMSRHDAIELDESLDAGDVSRAWLVWSGAAETALADACQFCGGLIPTKGLVLGRRSALFRIVRLGRHKVRKARGNAADAHDAADVFLYRDSSIAPLLDMKRRFKAVMNVLGAMIQYGVSLARSVEQSAGRGLTRSRPLSSSLLKCPRSSSRASLRDSRVANRRLTSRPLAFQFLVVDGVSLVFKVFSLNRVQQRRSFLRKAFLSGLWSRTLILPFPVEVLKVFAQDRVHVHHFHLQLVFMKTWMSLF